MQNSVCVLVCLLLMKILCRLTLTIDTNRRNLSLSLCELKQASRNVTKSSICNMDLNLSQLLIINHEATHADDNPSVAINRH